MPAALAALVGLASLAGGSWGTAPSLAQTVPGERSPGLTAQSPQISVDDASVQEGDAGTRDLVFTVRLSEPSPDTVSVDVATADSTATTADGDYAAVSQRLTFMPGSVAESLVVAVNGDTAYEPDEKLLVRLANASFAALADSEAVGTILNDDRPLLSIDDAAVAEGDAGTRELVFRMHLSAQSPDTVSVDVATSDSTATVAGGDYSAASQRLTFLPGSVAESLVVVVNGDTAYEPDETLLVRLANASFAALADSEAVGTIVNDDSLTVSVDDAAVAEGDAGTSALVFRLRLSGASTEPVTVTVSTADSTATAADLDYQPAITPVTFAPGSVAESLVVLVNGDTRPEPDEVLAVRLSAPVGATLADSEAVGVILNDDLPLLSVDDASVTEGDAGTRSLWFRLHLSTPAGYPVSVDFATADSTATVAGGDYVSVNLRLTFPPGATEDSVEVTVKGDLDVEFDELMRVRLSAPVAAALADSEAVGVIVNDDLPSVSARDSSCAEGDSGVSWMTFRVSLDHPVSTPVVFQYRCFDATATVADRDYSGGARDTVFEPGTDQVLVRIPVFGDSLLEGNESFRLRISNVRGGRPALLFVTGTLWNDERTSFASYSPAVRMYHPGTLPPAFGDLEGNDLPDLPLYLNQAIGFTEMPGIRTLLGDGNYHGGAWCDYDRDGDQDLVLMPYTSTQSDYNFTHLFENTPGGLVETAPAKGMDIEGFGETPAWGDFDADGWPDLFLPFYAHVAPFQSFLYLNRGDGTFREYSDSAGVSLRDVPEGLKPEGVGVADWNGDGSLDLYCASHLFLNDGDAHFTDVRAQTGLPAMFDEGAQFVDYDNDGDLDLYLRTGRGPTLYRNDSGQFTDATASLGVGNPGWEWGDRWADLDSDGDLDLMFFPPGAVARLLLNRGDGTFMEDSSFIGVFSGSSLSSFADMDGDGDIDIAVGANGRQIGRNLLERIPRAGQSYLKVRVEDDGGRLTAHGATVRLRSRDDPRHPIQTRIVDGGSGYLGQDEYTLTFGGLSSGAYDLEVSYPAKPGQARVVGPQQNALLAGIAPGVLGPLLVTVRPAGQVAIEPIAFTADVDRPLPHTSSILWPISPNPARRTARLDFALPATGEMSLTIHDLSGRRVRTLVRGARAAGTASVGWDLRDDSGREVRAGLYFACLRYAGRVQGVQRVAVLR